MARLTIGVLFKEILDRFQDKVNFNLKPNRSAWLYSAHDSTIAGLLNILGLYNVRKYD